MKASGGDFDALAERRANEARRPGSHEQFKKEFTEAQQRKNVRSGLDAEHQRRCQSESEERQKYSSQRAEEIKAREGGTPSSVTSSPSVAAPEAPAKQKKTITWAEYQSRPPWDDLHQEGQGDIHEEAEWEERLRKSQAELEHRQREVDRLKREYEELNEERERQQAGRRQLERLRAE